MASPFLTQELTDLVRELQKLSKELNPVKTAIGALKKREDATPNPQAAAASLEKIAARVDGVRAKYQPFIDRTLQLLSDDIPQSLLQAPVAAVSRVQLTEAVDHVRRGMAGKLSNPGGNSQADAGASKLEEETNIGDNNNNKAAELLADVCPSQFPFAIPPEYYEVYHDQLRLRVEMVDYLIATGRLELARTAAVGYQLPLAWFPSLTETLTTASTLTASLSLISPLATPAMGSSGGGGAHASPMSGIIESPERSNVNNNCSTPMHRPSPSCAASPSSSDLPDLVARVIAAGIFVKDEYFDRMVLERLISTHDDEQQSAADNASDSNEGRAEVYDRALVERVRNVARSHICTQSGSTQFDISMMNVIEELLVGGLMKKQAHGGTVEDNNSIFSSATLTPDQLLTADSTWNSDILFVRKPTRYYCVHSGITMDGSTDGTYPLALPNGMVVSRDGLMAHLIKGKDATGAYGAPHGCGVVCPPSATVYDFNELRRIFVA